MSEPDDTGIDLSDTLTGGPHLPSHVYVHVPFCRVKCSYCDFFSTDDLAEETIEALLRGVEGQFTQWGNAELPGVVETLYLGGGTPTIIVGGAIRILRSAMEHLPMRAGLEVTVEANPDSVTPALMEAFAAAGVTRVSLGVQSFVESEIALLGRVHTVEESLAACDAVRTAGMGLSVDLMCGVPGQTYASWTGSLETAVATGADHISVYPLTLEEGTPLAVAVDTGLVEEPDPDLTAEFMIIAEELLSVAGLPRYEISNYARAGHESRHNIAYWTGRQYLAIGPGASGMLDRATAVAIGLLTPAKATSTAGEAAHDPERGEVARVRFTNPRDVEGWLTLDPIDVEYLSAAEVAREDVMLGLRLVRGVPHTQVLEANLGPVLTRLEEEGLVVRVSASGKVFDEAGVFPSMRWRTTRRGWLLGNEVFSQVWEG